MLHSIDELIKALGGVPRAAQTLNVPESTLRVWKTRGHAPARLFVSHVQTLDALGMQASPSIWKQESLPGAA